MRGARLVAAAALASVAALAPTSVGAWSPATARRALAPTQTAEASRAALPASLTDQEFWANVATRPLDARSTFIRSARGQRLGSTQNETQGCRGGMPGQKGAPLIAARL
jgi:hypothetical protein